jgi:hypothetical protein
MSKVKLQIYDADIQNERQFNDAVIGALLINYDFISFRAIAEMTDLTERRIMQAAERLINAKRILKINNYVIPELSCQGNLQEINQARADFLKWHGLRTPAPVYHKGDWTLVWYLPNSYGIIADEEPGTQFTPNFRKIFYKLESRTPLYNLFSFIDAESQEDYLSTHGFKYV